MVKNWLNSKPIVLGTGFGLVGLCGLVDYATGPQLSLALFYFVPIFFVAWFAGRWAGLIIAVSAAGVWLSADLLWPVRFDRWWVPYFNLASRGGSFVIGAWLMSRFRTIAGTLENRVAGRTVELQNQIAERKRAEEKWRSREELFRQLAENISEVFWMTSADRKQLIYISPAYERVWGHTCASLHQSPGAWMQAIHPEDRARVADAVAYQPPGQYNVEYRIVRPDGSVRWIRDRAFPILDPDGKLYRIAGIAEDITRTKQMELALLETTDREQARIGQDLHDGLCQLLVSIAFDCNSLQQHLSALAPGEAAEAGRIANFLDEAITQARQVARGLYPVRLETDGLTSALEELAANVTTRFKVHCDLECDEPIALSDHAMATHLYRIAQEAVTNAVRHAGASRIQIRLHRQNGSLQLAVSDDGIGFQPRRDGQGMGLQIMDYRTRTLGGTLQIQALPGAGTAVACCVPAEPVPIKP